MIEYPSRNAGWRTRCAYCPHQADEHTARGGCMRRKESGSICECSWTAGPAQGKNPFAKTNTTNFLKGK